MRNEIKVGGTVERIAVQIECFEIGERAVIEKIDSTGRLYFNNKPNGWHGFGAEFFKQVKGATMTPIQKLEKEHAETAVKIKEAAENHEAMANTIKAMKEAEKAVWSAGDVSQLNDTFIKNSDGERCSIICSALLTDNSFILVDNWNILHSMEWLHRSEMAEYLNKKGYTKA